MKILAATDIHYLSPSLFTMGSESFQRFLDTNNGKATQYSREILDAFVKTVIKEHPDICVFTGDITCNGEFRSMLDVYEAFKIIEAHDIPVLAIPGNHDILYSSAYEFHEDQCRPTRSITKDEWKKYMGEFGYNHAKMKDPYSFSYLYEIDGSLSILAMDANTEGNIGSITEDTITFIEHALSASKSVITISHQNVLKQSEMMYKGFVINNHEEVFSILQKHGVHLNLSGHSHLQHTSSLDNFTDICTESLSTYPLRYGIVEIDEDSFSYTKKDLGILQKESKQCFDQVTRRMLSRILDTLDLSETTKEEMMDYAIVFNTYFFTDDDSHKEELKNDPRVRLWQKNASDSFWAKYMHAYFNE